MSTYSTNSS